VIFEQLALIYALPKYFVKSLKVIVPYFSTGTMERVQEYGEVATAKTLARMLSATPLCARGPPQISVLDIHTLQNQFYFGDEVLVRLMTASDILINELKTLPDYDKVSIAFPDEGAWKRFHENFKDFPLVIWHKGRDGDSRIVKVKEGECGGCHVVIVDDLVQSGGTMIEAAKVIHKLGASRVSAFATHGIFPKDAWKKFLHDPKTGKRGEGEFANFWVTNSHPATHVLKKGASPFKVLSIAPVVHEIMVET